MSETANGLTLHADDPVALKLAEAQGILAAAKSVDELVNGLHMTQTIQYILRRRGYALESRQDAAELTVRYERHLGELLQSSVVARGNHAPGKEGSAPSLPEGVDKYQSHRWQRMATVASEPFEQHIKQVRERGEVVTSTSVRNLARQIQQADKKDEQPFELLDELNDIQDWLARRRKAWPDEFRERFFDLVRTQLDSLEAETNASGRSGLEDSHAEEGEAEGGTGPVSERGSGAA